MCLLSTTAVCAGDSASWAGELGSVMPSAGPCQGAVIIYQFCAELRSSSKGFPWCFRAQWVRMLVMVARSRAGEHVASTAASVKIFVIVS